MPQDILIVDDERDICEMVSDVLIDAGYEARFAYDSIKALEEIKRKIPNALVVDICMEKSKIDGLALLEIVKKKYPSVPVIIISGHGTISTAVQSLKIGAADYIEKPFTHEKIREVVKTVLKKTKVEGQDFELLGNSSLIKKLRFELNKLAKHDSRILIEGPVGVGKENLANWMHRNSKRSEGAFIVVNSSIFIDLKEGIKKLFGTGKKNEPFNVQEECLLEKANKGTLFLQEINEFPIQVQQRLLLFLKDKNLILNGKLLDIRIISSTSKSLDYIVKTGKLNADLLYRLNVTTIKIPPLRARYEDIPILCEYFLQKITEKHNIFITEICPQALGVIQNYFWPQNIQQLYEFLELAVLVAENRVTGAFKGKPGYNISISLEDLPQEMIEGSYISNEIPKKITELPLKEAREEFEKNYLSVQLNRFSNNISKTAEFVKMERSALYRKLKILRL